MNLSNALSDQCAKTNQAALRKNYTANLPTLKVARGVERLAGMFAGQTVVVAGAGPSLDEALPKLKEWGGPVIAADRAVRPLLAAGIKPIFAVAIEISPLGAKKFEGLGKLLRAVPLAFDPMVYPGTIDAYPGPLYTWNRPNFFFGKGDIRLGTGVATYAVGLAEIMAAGQIALTGVDLAYPNGQNHARGVIEFEDSNVGGVLHIKDVRGNLVKTDTFFGCVLEELVNAASEGAPLFQTSPIGAFIPGATHAPLEAVL